MMKDVVAMVCGTAVVITALLLDGATAQAIAAAFVGAGGFLAGFRTGQTKGGGAVVPLES